MTRGGAIERNAPAFRNGPANVLRRILRANATARQRTRARNARATHLDRTRLAVNAVLRVDLQSLAAAVGVVDESARTDRVETAVDFESDLFRNAHAYS